MRNNSLKLRGFSLVELLTVMAMIALIVALAQSGYRDAVVESHQSKGREFAARILGDQSAFYLENRTYTTTLGDIGLTTAFSTPAYYKAALAACPSETIKSCIQVTVTPTTKFGADNTLKIVANSRNSWVETE